MLLAGVVSLGMAVALLGCSESRAPERRGDPPAKTANPGEPSGEMTPEEVAALMLGESPPPAKPSSKPAVPSEPLPAGAISLGAKLTIAVPKSWIRKPPRMGLIEHEFAVPAAEGDADDGRVTIMAAGGSVDANIQRWIGQYTQPDGSATADKTKIEHKAIAGRKVHLVDISGTYRESMGGPFAGGQVVERPGYRMLAAIVETAQGKYFIKFYGPRKTVTGQANAFRAMIEGLKER